MTAATLGASSQRPPSPGGEWQGAVLSVLVHTGLVAVLLLGFRWQTPPPSAASAELWAAPPQVQATAVQPQPVPVPRPAPVPVKPTPTPDRPDADIALEKTRKAKAEEEQRRKEQQTKEQRELRERRERAEREKADKARQAEAAERAAQAERDAKAKLEAQRREQAAAEKVLARQREENLARMMGQLGAAGSGSDARGTAAVGGGRGPSASYAGKLIQAIKPNIVFGDTFSGNPAAEVEVRTGPGGTIIGSSLVRSSGNAEWDNAVLRAIERTGTLPRDTDGRVPPQITIIFRPRD